MVTAEHITALGGIIAALATLWKVLAEARKIRAEVDVLRSTAVQTRAQLMPDSGLSARDAINRTETTSAAVLTVLDEVRGDLRGMRRDVGRLADEDLAVRRDTAAAHAQFDARIARLENQGCPPR